MRSRLVAFVRQLLREGLEGALAPAQASAVIFDALAAEGLDEPPKDPSQLCAFIGGSLRTQLDGKLGEGAAEALSLQLEQMVRAVFAGKKKRPSSAPTVKHALVAGPVDVMVVSATPALANRLRTALGGGVVNALVTPDAGSCARIIESVDPTLVLVDATASLPSDMEGIARALRGCEALVLLWGVERPAAQVAARLFPDGVKLREEEGASSLIDFILSRRAG